MKNATRYCAFSALKLWLQDVLNRRLLFKTNRQWHQRETITHHFFVSELGRRKLSMQPKFVAAQKMLLKQKPSKISVNGLLGFITLGIYTPLEAYCSAIIVRVAHRYGQLHLHCSLIHFPGFLPALFLHSDQPLSEGEIIPAPQNR